MSKLFSNLHLRKTFSKSPKNQSLKHEILLQKTSSFLFSNDINSSLLQINKAPTTKKSQDTNFDNLLFGKIFTDHMLEINWTKKNGWEAPIIKPYNNLELSPASTCLSYAYQAFEGMKAYLDTENNVRLFRPDKNMERMLRSCDALGMPSFNGDEFINCIKKLIMLEKDWIPKRNGFGLYIRPTVISTDEDINTDLKPVESIKLYCILSPVGPYISGFRPIDLYADNKNIRAWRGGIGCNKLGANYGPTVYPHMFAEKLGYDQILWLVENNIAEVGTMNFFLYWENTLGNKELITAPLDGTILPGVTRESVIELVKSWNDPNISVVEKEFTIDDFIKASNEGRIIESFGTGTAAIVAPVKGIGYSGKHYEIPLDINNSSEEFSGPLAKRIYKEITDIQYGIIEHPWSVLIKDEMIEKIE